MYQKPKFPDLRTVASDEGWVTPGEPPVIRWPAGAIRLQAGVPMKALLFRFRITFSSQRDCASVWNSCRLSGTIMRRRFIGVVGKCDR